MPSNKIGFIDNDLEEILRFKDNTPRDLSNNSPPPTQRSPEKKKAKKRNDDSDAAPKKKLSATAKVMKFLFSEGGLILIIVTYIIAGGLLFKMLESGGESDAMTSLYNKAQIIETKREALVEALLKVTAHALENNYNRSWAIPLYQSELDDYQSLIIDACADGYSGRPVKEEDGNHGWSLSSSILFTATILTTIGYGHVTPVTEVGRLVCILYSIVAVPLMSIFLIKVGAAVAAGIKILYNRGICTLCGNRRNVKLDSDLRERRRPQPTWDAEQEVDERGYLKKTPKLECDDDIEYDTVEDVWLFYNDYNNSIPPTTLLLFITFIYILLGTIFFHLVEDGWSLVNALYCCMITLTTIGFGDLVPGIGDESIVGQLKLGSTALYVMVGLAIIGMAISVVGETMEKMRDAARQKAADLKQREDDALERQQKLAAGDDPFAVEEYIPPIV